jgi:hypothetical protein
VPTPNQVQGVGDFVSLGEALWEMRDKDALLAFCTNLNRLRDAAQSASGGDGGGRTVVVVNTGNGTAGSGGTPQTPTGDVAKPNVIEGCNPQTGVTLNAAVFVDGNRNAYLATATDATRPCTGIVVKVKNLGNLGTKVDVQAPSGACIAQLADMTANEGQLWLSTTAGKLTNNYNQTGKAINQECGTFVTYVTNSLNQTVTTLGNVSLACSSAVPSASFGTV